MTIDLAVIFIGIQIMAALNILNDYMKLIDKKAKKIPNYLKLIIIRHNDIIDKVNLFNGAIQKTAFVQILTILCIFGELVKMKTERLSETLYLTNWYELSVKDQKAFLLILAMAQKDFGLKAAGIWGMRFIVLSATAISVAMTPNSDFGLFMKILGPKTVPEEVDYLIQIIMMAISAISVCTIDLAVIFIGIQIMAALNILNDYMKLIDKKVKEIPNYLKLIIIRHNDIIKNINSFKESIEKTAFVQVASSSLLLIFIFLFVRKESNQITAYVLCLTGISQILLLCIFGELLKIKTERLSATLYLTNWYELSVKDQKMFLLVLAMAQKDFGLKAAGMYDVNLNAFLKILKLAMSYCAILYSLSN
ncbi:odorant receptor 4-like [Phlebotomus argentipes]|uniref:odorant receptor 4-like n=1 Tax=Phlebotomus argentipes TaxID=94469 RepID=UPI002892BBD6|nr:odorant receptor 4-like [Phlebotomus argentipes]